MHGLIIAREYIVLALGRLRYHLTDLLLIKTISRFTAWYSRSNTIILTETSEGPTSSIRS